MTEIVARRAALAQTGDGIVLSPGCRKLRHVQEFQDRGNQFRQAVQAPA